MRLKPDSRCKLAALSAEKRELLDTWLFDENLSFAEINKRTVKMWNLRLHNTTLTRYYRTNFQRRTLLRVADSARCANALMKQFEEHPADTYQLVLKMAGQIAFEKSLVKKEDLDTRSIGELIKILIAARKEDLEIQKLRLERDKWEFDAARACREHVAELQAVTKDDYLDEDAQVLAIRRRLFGNIEHETLEVLEGRCYGKAKVFLKRPNPLCQKPDQLKILPESGL